jgi:ribosomal protein S18 acetylase RimI-like enzyme
MTHPLHNIMWQTMTCQHARFTLGGSTARRYAPGFSPLLGFADPRQPDFGALAGHCQAGEHFYCSDWSGPAPAGWTVTAETTMFRMLWDAAVPAEDAAPDALPLGPAHVQQALDLTGLTRPGPFGPRTMELGDYFGIFDGPVLAAMAGERMVAGTLREVSGVCTHPDFQGRGLARRLMLKLVRRQLLRGETPFLHVMRDNVGARRLYARMGFRDHAETVVRVVAHG